MTTISLDKAQADLPDLVRRALGGEDILIDASPNGGHVKLAVVQMPAFDSETARKRGCGSLKDSFTVGSEFFEPLTDEECGVGGGS